jgi:hypothetical protein
MEEKQVWIGKSGNSYTYNVFSIDINFNPNQNGNYIFCKKINGIWTPLYIGEGDLKERVEFRRNEGCVTQKGATHIHAHLNSGNRARLDEEDDLLNKHPESYKPTGCNERKGG